MDGKTVGRKVLHGAPAAILAASGAMKFANREAPSQFADWGYPRWWAWVTGATELAAAGLLSDRRSALVGAGLGTSILAGAFATHLRHRELPMLAPPVVTGALMVGSLWAWRRPEVPKEAREGFPAQLEAERRALQGVSNREP